MITYLFQNRPVIRVQLPDVVICQDTEHTDNTELELRETLFVQSTLNYLILALPGSKRNLAHHP
jgi:hypothetical protein